jgi:hypothetical protein
MEERVGWMKKIVKILERDGRHFGITQPGLFTFD